MIIEIFWLVLGLGLVVLGSNWLVDGAASLARKMDVPDLVIGLTIVAFGTSSPELTVNLVASFRGSTEIAMGNILGSNIFNILVILGLSALIYPVAVQKNTVWKEIPYSLLAVVILGVCANDVFIDKAPASILSRIDGIILLGFFTIFMVYTFVLAREGNQGDDQGNTRVYSTWVSLLLVVVGLIGLVAGGRWMVNSGIEIARVAGISESIIGLTIMAIGTSIPELATSAVAAWKRNSDIAIGNIVGSNIFNIFMVLGTSAIIRPLPVQATSNPDILVTLMATFLMFLFVFLGKGHKIGRIEGGVFIFLYLAYMTFLLN
jgi:cation:H+ antiporter